MAKVLASFLAVIAVTSVYGSSNRTNVAPALRSAKACPVPFQNIASGCYYFGNPSMKKNWWRAAEYCRVIGGNLITIESPVENDYIQDHLLRYFRGRNFFVGGYDLGHEGTWYWQGTLKPVDYTDWFPGAPDNYRGNENCMSLVSSYAFRWDDRNCALANQGFICEA